MFLRFEPNDCYAEVDGLVMLVSVQNLFVVPMGLGAAEVADLLGHPAFLEARYQVQKLRGGGRKSAGAT